MQAEIYNGAPMRTVLKTGGHTLLRAEIYRPVAVYLRLLALLVATYLGTAQCHNYSDKQSNKGGGLLQLFASRDCRPDVQSRGMACAALRVATCLLRAWRDSYG
jgi:hypothetical protein